MHCFAQIPMGNNSVKMLVKEEMGLCIKNSLGT